MNKTIQFILLFFPAYSLLFLMLFNYIMLQYSAIRLLRLGCNFCLISSSDSIWNNKIQAFSKNWFGSFTSISAFDNLKRIMCLSSNSFYSINSSFELSFLMKLKYSNLSSFDNCKSINIFQNLFFTSKSPDINKIFTYRFYQNISLVVFSEHFIYFLGDHLIRCCYTFFVIYFGSMFKKPV